MQTVQKEAGRLVFRLTDLDRTTAQSKICTDDGIGSLMLSLISAPELLSNQRSHQLRRPLRSKLQNASPNPSELSTLPY